VQGRQFRVLLPRGGLVLYVLGDTAASSTRDRRRGMREIVGADRSFQVEEVDGLWSPEESRRCVTRWLAGASRLDRWPRLIGCQNDAMALGARDALTEAAQLYARPALRDVPVTGGDGLPEEGQRWVGEGKLAATVVAPLTTTVAVEHLVRTWKTGLPMPLVTKLPVAPFPAFAGLRPRPA
jgi:ABC-type sugar transport system substrate-binding protein